MDINFSASYRSCRRIALLLLMAFCSLTTLSGCGSNRPETFPVSGKVTLGGKPLTFGQITFYPEKGRLAMGTIDSDGTYELTTLEKGDGALPGQHKVIIVAKQIQKNGPTLKNFEEEMKMRVNPVGPTKVQWIVPKRYAYRKTTPLETEVICGKDNKADFDIPLP